MQRRQKCFLPGVLILSSVALPWARAALVRAEVMIEWAPVGDPGNANDPATGGIYTPSVGAVSYPYQIGKKEVSNGQYVEFLNAADPSGANARALYNGYMSNHPDGVAHTGGINYTAGAAAGAKYSIKPGQGNLPVIWVSWNDAARFVNWLSNGQGAGSTENGVYDMSQAQPARAGNAGIFLPTRDEWHKAAYYQPVSAGGDTDGYWRYATRSNQAPHSDNPAALDFPANSANFYFKSIFNPVGYDGGYAVTGSTVFNPAQNYLTDVGAYGLAGSYYGTFDQTGNVEEWTETPFDIFREIAGGRWEDGWYEVAADYGGVAADQTAAYYTYGFRVASIPEPSVLALAGVAMMGLAKPRRRLHCA